MKRFEDAEASAAFHRTAILCLFFCSGFTGLVYEVLWMKELGLLFGHTVQAAATTLAAFFLGLVAGARYWGRRAQSFRRPLRVYACLEAGVAISALLYFFLLPAYHKLYAPLYQTLGDSPGLLLAVKFLLAALVLFPPSFFMGGTLPMMSQHLVRRAEKLGRTASALYALNTLGAALGAYLAGFHLPPLLGFDRSYQLAIGTTFAIALAAWLLGGGPAPQPGRFRNGTSRAQVGDELLSPTSLRSLAFFSGFMALGLEVLWTRMFAQALQNSVFTFSTILVTFLLALGLGAGLARQLIHRAMPAVRVLFWLLAASALLVGLSPFIFHWFTNGMNHLGGHVGFSRHGSFWSAACVMLAPGLFVGSVFPFLLRLAEPHAESAGRAVGDLSAVNMIGSVAGSLAFGFFLLDFLGLWSSIRLVGLGYAGAAFLVAQLCPARNWYRLAPLTVLLLQVSFLDPSRLPIVALDPVEKEESLLQVWESSSAIVSVVRQPGALSIKMDNAYSLGGTGAALSEERQAHLPLFLHSRPRTIFFLGMGTGITAGAALLHPVERVVVCELSQDVVRAAQTFFRPYVHGLFEDPRVKVVSEDGRNYLFGTNEQFDLIIADLFMPWRAGVGSLYSLEHYQAAQRRLEPGGLYVQWLPLFQVSRWEFGVVARTMSEVFPQVTLWRGIITPGWETAMLVGHRDVQPLDLESVERRLQQAKAVAANEVPLESRSTDGSDQDGVQIAGRLHSKDFLLRYCGNLTAAAQLWEKHPINTDDLPVFEYQAPLTHLQVDARKSAWLIGREFLSLLKRLFVVASPESDPFLRNLSPAEKRLPQAGLILYSVKLQEFEGDREGSLRARQEFLRLYEPDLPWAVESEAEQSRRELGQLIEKYEQRLRALRERLREAEEERQ